MILDGDSPTVGFVRESNKSFYFNILNNFPMKLRQLAHFLLPHFYSTRVVCKILGFSSLLVFVNRYEVPGLKQGSAITT
jgi:hypothetical protein